MHQSRFNFSNMFTTLQYIISNTKLVVPSENDFRDKTKKYRLLQRYGIFTKFVKLKKIPKY